MKSLLHDLKKEGIEVGKTIFCAENTGDYGRKLCDFLQKKGLYIWEECPIKIKKSFRILIGKNDQIDSYRIAAYAYRYQEEFSPSPAKTASLKVIIQLLAFRMLLVKMNKMIKVFIQEKKCCLSQKELGGVPQVCAVYR